MKTTTNLLTLIFMLAFQLIAAQSNESPDDNYCKIYTSRGNNYITNVRFSTIDNSSEYGTNGYSNFTDQKAVIDKGNEYEFEVQTKWGHWPYITIQAWIDWNGNSSFETSERVFYKNGTAPASGFIIVPDDAIIGTTRMRIRYNYDAALDPCEINYDKKGEVEDYTIEILNPKRPRSRFTESSTYINDDKDLVEFEDKSTNNPTSWYWEFEGGIPSISTAQHPLVRYIRSGNFSVKLVVENEFGKDEIMYKNHITVRIPDPVYPPISNFSTVLTHVTDANEYVRFDDLSENNPTYWYWEFEGATPATSTEQIPQVRYSKSGKYSVKLTVTNQVGQDVKTIEDYITVDLAPKELCSSSNEKPNGQYITNVEFSNVRSISTYSNNGYDRYNFPGTTVERGPIVYPNEASVIHIKTNQVWEKTKTAYWVDWNQDGDFSDQGERKELNSPYPSSGKDWVSFFVIPEDAKLGETILRVRTTYDDELSPCGSAWFGETEDYVITVIDAPVPEPSRIAASNVIVSPNPSSDGVFNFTFNEAVENVNFTVFDDRGFEVHASKGNASGNSIGLNISDLNSGLYTVQIRTKNQSETARVLIK